MFKSQSIICLMGPTASGKTALAFELVKKLPVEIISVDSGMIYRGMDIGTAKPTAAELAFAPHRLINICDPAESYSVGQFCHDALREIAEIIANQKIPLLVGGTMLYFKALLHGISDLPPADAKIRAQISAEAAQAGWPKLHARLQQIDPQAAARISANDSQRIQRALEVYELTGMNISQLHAKNPRVILPYRALNFALLPNDRAALHERIKIRLTLMLKQGLIAEVEKLFHRGDLHCDLPSMRTVGYRQVWQYLEGKINYDEMVEQILAATRQLAKRQMTWLRSFASLNLLCSENGCLADELIDLVKRNFSI